MAALSPTIVLFLHVAGLVLTAGLSVAAAVWIHRRTADRAGTYLIAILLTTCVMAVLSIFALLVSTQPWHRFLSGTIFAFVWLV